MLGTTRQTGFPLLHDYLVQSAQRAPEKIALVCQNQRLSYAELDARSNALAHALGRRSTTAGCAPPRRSSVAAGPQPNHNDFSRRTAGG